MNSSRNRLLSISTDTSSRSASPASESILERPTAALRAVLLGLVAASEARDSEVESMSQRRLQTLGVNGTQGGTLDNVTEEGVIVHKSPNENHLSVENNVPLCSDVLERVEAMDVSEEEVEELLEAAPWHVRRWVSGLGLEGQGGSVPRSLTPSASAEVDLSASVLGNVPVENVTTEQHITKVSSGGGGVAVIPDFEVLPSTSGARAKSKPVRRREIRDGSDLDSEYDDEFDISIEPTALTEIGKDIPDDEELEEPIRDIIGNIERGMDDEADRLLGISSDFKWVKGFKSFKGVPEQFSGPTPGPLRDYDSPYDAFTDIWDKDIIERIALEINRYAKQTIDALNNKGEMKHSSRIHEWTDTNADEVMVLFGVYMYMAIDPRTSQNEYWAKGVLELPKFKRLMGYNRYLLLSKFLHFVDNSESRRGDVSASKMSCKLYKLSPIIEHLGKKFKSLYNLRRNIAIDESLTLFKGRLSWVQAIRTKAARFGIKSYELCESQTGYMADFQIYTGKSSATCNDASLSVDLGGKSTKVVLELLQGLEHRGHCVTMDNFYNSPSLARYLKSRGFDCLGTLRTNRRNVPDDIAKIPTSLPKGTIISRQCGDVSIMTWKDSKLVSIISTYHDDSTFVVPKSGKIRPVCVKDYNSTMGGIDVKDQKLSMYLLERKRGLKWYVKLFKRLLNVSIHNAFIMYVSSLKRRKKLAVTHREFRYALAYSLTKRHGQCRPEIKESVGQLMRLRRDVVHVPKYESGRNNRKRCVVCYRLMITKLVHTQCSTCDVFLCFEGCWKNWHSSVKLKGQEIWRRKRRLDE